MAFQINLTSFFNGVVKEAEDVKTLAEKSGFYIQVVEQVGKALSMSTAQKQALFQNLLVKDIEAWSQPLADEIKAAWPKVQGVINAIISLFNLVGWAFAAVAPIIEAAAPSSISAISAINAAVAAIKAATNGPNPPGYGDPQPAQ